MQSEYLSRLESLVSQALLLPLDERASFLERECGDEASLRSDVELVLAHQEETLLEEQRAGTTETRPGVLTVLLRATRGGDDEARERFWAIVLDDLRNTARRVLAREYRLDLPESLSLVVRAWERVDRSRSIDWKNRKYFFGAVNQAMRRIIIEVIRGRPSAGPLVEDLASRSGVEPRELPRLGDALERLAGVHPRAADVIRFRVFVGMTVAETALATGIGDRQVKYDFKFARAWLHRELAEERDAG